MTTSSTFSAPARASLLAGFLGPIVFTAILLVQDLLRPDADPVRSWVSHLSLGALGWVNVVALIGLGLCIIVFGVGARDRLRVTRRATPWVAVTATGVALVLAGAFVADPPGWSDIAEPSSPVTGIVHDIAGTAAFAGLALTCFFTSRHVSRAWGIAAGCVVIGAWFAASTLVALDYAGVLTPGVSGLAERLAMLAGLAWISTLAGTLLHRGRRSGGRADAAAAAPLGSTTTGMNR